MISTPLLVQLLEHTDPGDSERSRKRLTTLLHWPGSDQSPEAHAQLGVYDLGVRRTLNQYAQFSGMDTTQRKDFVKNWACENLTYQNWLTDNAYTEYHIAPAAHAATTIDKDLGNAGRAENNRANLLKIISFAMLAMSCLLALTWKLNLLEKKEDNSKYAV